MRAVVLDHTLYWVVGIALALAQAQVETRKTQWSTLTMLRCVWLGRIWAGRLQAIRAVMPLTLPRAE